MKPGDEFPGIGPDGKPATFRIAEGRMYYHMCPDCGETNGGGVEQPGEQARSVVDPYSPLHVPCIWCGKGPMVLEYEDGI